MDKIQYIPFSDNPLDPNRYDKIRVQVKDVQTLRTHIQESRWKSIERHENVVMFVESFLAYFPRPYDDGCEMRESEIYANLWEEVFELLQTMCVYMYPIVWVGSESMHVVKCCILRVYIFVCFRFVHENRQCGPSAATCATR